MWNALITAQHGTGFLMQNGGIVPPSLLQESRVPRFYKEAIARCGAANPSQLPNTGLVYNLMVTSRLPRTVLGNIWSLVNRTLPGQLTRQEFFSCLALIALIQKGQPLSALSTMSSLPIPHFQACAPFGQYLPDAGDSKQQGYSETVQNSSVETHATASTSSAISLLSDINFNLPSSSSSNFSQNNVTQTEAPVPASQSQSSISWIGTSQTNNTYGASKIRMEDVRQQSVKSMADSDGWILSNDILEKAGNLQQSSVSVDQIAMVSADTVNRAGSISVAKSTTEIENNMTKTADVTDAGTVLEPIRNSDVYAAVQLIFDSKEEEKEECIRVWQRCLEEAHKLFSDADLLLPDGAATHISEIVHTDRGARYFKALREVYHMTVRIRKGRKDKLNQQMEALREIDRIWSRFQGFMEQDGDNDDMEHSTSLSSINESFPACGICLSRISANSLLEFTGTAYHKQCANLWINRVDSLLPKLKFE